MEINWNLIAKIHIGVVTDELLQPQSVASHQQHGTGWKDEAEILEYRLAALDGTDCWGGVTFKQEVKWRKQEPFSSKKRNMLTKQFYKWEWPLGNGLKQAATDGWVSSPRQIQRHKSGEQIRITTRGMVSPWRLTIHCQIKLIEQWFEA